MLFNLNPTGSTNVTEDTRGPETSTSVAVTTTASVALAANASRTNYSVYNVGNATVYLREATTVTAALYKVAIPPGYFWKEDFAGGSRYLGAVSVVGAAASTCLVSESSTV
jgi:hypothetical protein